MSADGIGVIHIQWLPGKIINDDEEDGERAVQSSTAGAAPRTYFLSTFPEDVANKVVLITGASSDIGDVHQRSVQIKTASGVA
jgi:hypothetical protein